MQAENTHTKVQQATANSTRDDMQQQPTDTILSAEIGGPKGLEPTRYGDWERRGRCIDF